MRKEEEVELPVEDTRADRPKSRPARKAAVDTEPDDNIGEEILLGDATLAKLNVSRKVEGEEASVEKAEKTEQVSRTRGSKAKEEVTGSVELAE
jgi:hypothetical protein